jgi:hypothetical protein
LSVHLILVIDTSVRRERIGAAGGFLCARSDLIKYRQPLPRFGDDVKSDDLLAGRREVGWTPTHARPGTCNMLINSPG